MSNLLTFDEIINSLRRRTEVVKAKVFCLFFLCVIYGVFDGFIGIRCLKCHPSYVLSFRAIRKKPIAPYKLKICMLPKYFFYIRWKR